MGRPSHKGFSLLFVLLLLSVSLSSQANGPQSFTGKVLGISYGDTISVMCGDWVVIVRLYGIDSPKWGQPFGKEVEARASDTDRYGRIVGEVILPNGRNLSYELVGAGMAWWYRTDFPNDSILGAVEAVAQIGRRGLWAQENPIPPWEWRQGNRKPIEFRDI